MIMTGSPQIPIPNHTKYISYLIIFVIRKDSLNVLAFLFGIFCLYRLPCRHHELAKCLLLISFPSRYWVTHEALLFEVIKVLYSLISYKCFHLIGLIGTFPENTDIFTSSTLKGKNDLPLTYIYEPVYVIRSLF